MSAAVGAIIGALARLVLPGKQSISTLVTVILGILGSLVGNKRVAPPPTPTLVVLGIIAVVTCIVTAVFYAPWSLFLISFVASAHNDALMVGLALAGTYYAATRRPVRGVLLVTASIGIKPITILLLPFVGLLWAGPAAGWVRKFAAWAATAVLSSGVLLLSGIPYDLGAGWLLAILDPTPGFTGYSPSGFLSTQLSVIGNALGLPGDDLGATLRDVLKYVAWTVFSPAVQARVRYTPGRGKEPP